MKPKLRDYLTILMALVAIFLSGYGVGHLIGEKKGLKNAPLTIPINQNQDKDLPSWEERTLDRLQQDLSLTAEQELSVENEITLFSNEIKKSRYDVRHRYYLGLLALHDRIAPHLDPDQQKKLKKDQEKLQQTINRLFPSVSPDTSGR